MHKKKAGNNVRVQGRMSVPPQREMLALKNRRKVHGEERISECILGDVQVLNIVQMKGLTDKRKVNRERQSDQQRKIPRRARRPPASFTGLMN